MRFALRPSLSFRLFAAFLLFGQTAWAPNLAMANPNGGTVVAGQATIAAQGNTVNVTTHTNRAVVNWNSFSVGQGQVTNFHQPSASSAVLNRVTGLGNPSVIHGQINSNGNVYLINPSGVFVGPSGVVNTGGFTASTFDIGNQAFMRGGDLKFQGDSKASVVNQGTIHTGSGGAALIGHQVINSGTITSQGGNISLATGGSLTLSDGSRVIQADARTIANGISETAPLIKTTGTIRATGAVKSGGEVYLVGPGSRVVHDAVIAASKVNPQGQTLGGNVVVTGETIEVTKTIIAADGESGGGQVNLGGGYQGKNPAITNATDTTVDAATKITANATSEGDGGKVILWADGTMDFRGVIENRGTEGFAGGFTEVSGLEHLGFHGQVDTGGGDLLLDPFNYTINSIQAANLVLALANNSVTIQTTVGNSAFGSAAGVGNITVNDDVEWDSVNSLTFLAQGLVRFDANVISNKSGDLNIVAGWDGVTSFDADAYLAEDVTTTTVFGRSDAIVFVGTGGQDRSVRVGSRQGRTNVFGGNVFVRGGGESFASGHLGYSDLRGSEITGPINIRATERLEVVSGLDGAYTFGQIGHRNDLPETEQAFRGRSVNAPITVAVAGDIYIGRQIGVDGSPHAYAQLGHGGIGQAASFATGSGIGGIHQGNIHVIHAEEIRLQAGNSASTYAQLGNVAVISWGNITIDQASDILILAGNGDRLLEDMAASAGIGNGYISPSGRREGDITIAQAQDIHIRGGGGKDAFGFIGLASDGTGRGNISLNANSLELIGGSGPGSGVQVGNGNISSFTIGSRTLNLGDIDIRVAQEITLVDGTGENSRWLIGHATVSQNSSRIGDITIVTNSLDYEVDFHGNTTTINAGFAERINGTAGVIDGNLTIASTNTVAGPDGGMTIVGDFNGRFTESHNFLSAADLHVDNTIKTSEATGSANVNLVAGWDGSSGLTSTFNSTTFLAAEVANTTLFGNRGGSVFLGQSTATQATQVGSRFGHTNVFAHDLIMTGSGAVDQGHVMLGFRGTDRGNDFNITGPINVLLNGKLRAIAGNKEGSFVQIGHVGSDYTKIEGTVEANVNAPIRIEAREQIFLRGGGQASYAQVGHGGYFAEGSLFGDIDITTEDGLIGLFGGGSNVNSLAYARIGHGGFLSPGDRGGDITVTTDGDGFLHPGFAAAHAHIGHGGGLSDGTLSGDILFDVGGNLEVGNSTARAYGQVGHGGPMTTGDFSGKIDVNVGSNLTVRGTQFASEYGLIGHGNEPGGNDTGVSVAGDVTVGVGDGTRLLQAALGHAVDGGGVYASGKTFLAVGANNYSSANTTDTLLLGTSQLNSAANSDGGELRIYLPRRDSFSFAGTSSINGVDPATFGSNLPNLQGAAAPFTGDYNIDLNEGNFGFYIPPIQLTVNANSGFSTYGEVPNNPGLDLAVGDLNVGDTLASIGLTNNFNLTETSAAGEYVLVVDDTNLNSLYVLADTTDGLFTINKADFTITALNQTKTYGDDLIGLVPVLGAHFTVDGLQNGEVVDLVDLTSTGFEPTAKVADGPYTIVASNPTDSTGSGFDLNNYNDPTLVNGTLAVGKALLQITAENQSKTYGDRFRFDGDEFTTRGLKNGETVDTVTLRSPAALQTADTGQYRIRAENPSGTFDPDNYTVRFADGRFVVNKADLTITPLPRSKTYGDLLILGRRAFEAEGLKNNDQVLRVAMVSRGTPPLADAGTYDIVPIRITRTEGFNPDNYNISLNTLVDGLTVNPANLVILPRPRMKVYGDELPRNDRAFFAFGLKNDDRVTGVALRSPGIPATADAGLYDITATGILRSQSFNPNNYNVHLLTLPFGLLVKRAPLLIVPNTQFKPAQTEFVFDPTSDFTAFGLKNGETIGSVILRSRGTPADAAIGVYRIVARRPTDGTFDRSNYRVRFRPGALVVGPGFGELTYDQFVREQDQWRTLDALIGGRGNTGSISYGANDESEEGNLAEQDSFDVFGP